jgi:phospholipid N-methyltransferase
VPDPYPHQPAGSGFREHKLLFGRFLRNPRTVGAIAPSSRILARRMLRGVDLSGPVKIVELGSGTGSFTAEIVRRLGSSARFLAIELEPAFVTEVKARWPAIECVCASAETLDQLVRDRNLAPIDYIVSGLPFASLPAGMTAAILSGIRNTLRSGGTFTTFQYVHAYLLPAAGAFRRQATAALGSPPSVGLVVRNLPPAFVLTWRCR